MGIYVPMLAFWPSFPLFLCSKGRSVKNGFLVLRTRTNVDKGTYGFQLLPCKSLKSISLGNRRYNFWSKHFWDY